MAYALGALLLIGVPLLVLFVVAVGLVWGVLSLFITAASLYEKSKDGEL